MRTLMLSLAVAAPIVVSGCVMPPSGAALIQQTAQEFNFNLRFGRTELALEEVSAKYSDGFAKTHRGWGGSVHITDAETIGMKMKGLENCDIAVRIGWYRAEEGDLHMTMLKQHWHLYPGGWKLDGEDRIEGDIGALGENVEIVSPDSPTRSSQFPTVRLGTD